MNLFEFVFNRGIENETFGSVKDVIFWFRNAFFDSIGRCVPHIWEIYSSGITPRIYLKNAARPLELKFRLNEEGVDERLTSERLADLVNMNISAILADFLPEDVIESYPANEFYAHYSYKGKSLKAAVGFSDGTTVISEISGNPGILLCYGDAGSPFVESEGMADGRLLCNFVFYVGQGEPCEGCNDNNIKESIKVALINWSIINDRILDADTVVDDFYYDMSVGRGRGYVERESDARQICRFIEQSEETHSGDKMAGYINSANIIRNMGYDKLGRDIRCAGLHDMNDSLVRIKDETAQYYKLKRGRSIADKVNPSDIFLYSPDGFDADSSFIDRNSLVPFHRFASMDSDGGDILCISLKEGTSHLGRCGSFITKILDRYEGGLSVPILESCRSIYADEIGRIHLYKKFGDWYKDAGNPLKYYKELYGMAIEETETAMKISGMSDTVWKRNDLSDAFPTPDELACGNADWWERSELFNIMIYIKGMNIANELACLTIDGWRSFVRYSFGIQDKEGERFPFVKVRDYTRRILTDTKDYRKYVYDESEGYTEGMEDIDISHLSPVRFNYAQCTKRTKIKAPVTYKIPVIYR
ncbi:hypothetical protein EOM86_07325, partial [Candidatus Nomurabacteria bacterium]|nr:hypothetical protein [Candidatus Nomurabacteria bacterium]